MRRISRVLYLLIPLSITFFWLLGLVIGWYWWVLPIKGFLTLPRPLVTVINLFLVLGNSTVINLAAMLIVIKWYVDQRRPWQINRSVVIQ